MPNNLESVAWPAVRPLCAMLVLSFCCFGATSATVAAAPVAQKDASEPTGAQNSTSAQSHCVDVNGDLQAKNARTSGSSAGQRAMPHSNTGADDNSMSNSPPQSGSAAQQRQASNGPPC